MPKQPHDPAPAGGVEPGARQSARLDVELGELAVGRTGLAPVGAELRLGLAGQSVEPGVGGPGGGELGDLAVTGDRGVADGGIGRH